MKKKNGFVLFYLILFIPIIIIFIFELSLYIKEANRETSLNKINIVNHQIVNDIKNVFQSKVSFIIKGKPKLIEPFLNMPYEIEDIQYPVKMKIKQYDAGLVVGNLSAKQMKKVIRKVLEKYNIEYISELENLFYATFLNFNSHKFFYLELIKNIDYYIEVTEDESPALHLKSDLEKLFSIKYNITNPDEPFVSTNSIILSILLDKTVEEIRVLKLSVDIVSQSDKEFLEKLHIKVEDKAMFFYKIFFIILYKDFNVQITNSILYDLNKGRFIEKYNNRKFKYN